jgi:GrpB-like predicted nucleotidyltransferase (UPF0157 family)
MGDADEPVRIVPYDPVWPARFEQERRLIETTLGGPSGWHCATSLRAHPETAAEYDFVRSVVTRALAARSA